MDKKTKKKVGILALIVALYLVGCFFFLGDSGSDMDAAIVEVRVLIADTRREIKREMDKPLILRIFGSLFGMENGKFDELKNRLPAIIERGMPRFLKKKAKAASASGVDHYFGVG